jgi:beta-phosphoglucomutase-like phosphatase (HAD superfamily)
VTVSGDEVKHKKPAPDLYRRTLKLLRNPADVCLAIEDSEAGVLSAKANGLFCIALKNKYQKLEQLKSANYIVNTISEIVKLMKR